MRYLPLLLLALLAGLPAAPLQAEPAVPAIGRLNYAGFKASRHCTAFLVAPGTAATAAHCLQGLAPEALHLLLGYDRGPWREHLRPFSARPAGDGSDFALLCLSETARAAPFPWADSEPEAGEELIVLGYGRPRIHTQTRRSCPVLSASRAQVILDCPVAPGTSGAPVLRPTAEGFEAVAVVSASRAGTAVAVRPDPMLRRERCGG